MVTLPSIIERCIHAMNTQDLPALLDTFAEDALVNDQLQNYWGRGAIADWARHDVFAESLQLHVIWCIPHHGHPILIAHADGTFDKRGLPDPLEVNLYFTLEGARIVQLIILRDQSGTSLLNTSFARN